MLQYAEMEMRHRFVNHARNVWDRAVSLLPRVDQLWYKYVHMEEMLGNVAGARQVRATTRGLITALGLTNEAASHGSCWQCHMQLLAMPHAACVSIDHVAGIACGSLAMAVL